MPRPLDAVVTALVYRALTDPIACDELIASLEATRAVAVGDDAATIDSTLIALRAMREAVHPTLMGPGGNA